MAAMADGITSTDDLPPYVLDRLFDDDVGELSDRARGKTDTDSRSTFDGYPDVSDKECDGVNAEDVLRTVLSMLDDV